MKKLLIILVLFIANSSFAQEVRDHRSDDNKKPYTPSPLKPPPAEKKKMTQPGSLLHTLVNSKNWSAAFG
jgi:hypothetical protein